MTTPGVSICPAVSNNHLEMLMIRPYSSVLFFLKSRLGSLNRKYYITIIHALYRPNRNRNRHHLSCLMNGKRCLLHKDHSDS